MGGGGIAFVGKEMLEKFRGKIQNFPPLKALKKTLGTLVAELNSEFYSTGMYFERITELGAL